MRIPWRWETSLLIQWLFLKTINAPKWFKCAGLSPPGLPKRYCGARRQLILQPQLCHIYVLRTREPNSFLVLRSCTLINEIMGITLSFYQYKPNVKTGCLMVRSQDPDSDRTLVKANESTGHLKRRAKLLAFPSILSATVIAKAMNDFTLRPSYDFAHPSPGWLCHQNGHSEGAVK